VQALRSQAGVQIYNIDATGPQNLADIELFLRERFVGQLDEQARGQLLAQLRSDAHAEADGLVDAFVRRVVAASQGNFSYVRRYVDAWRLALHPIAGQPAVDPAGLLKFDPLSLAGVLDATYDAIYAQVRGAIDVQPADADDDVLGTLAIAFEPLTLQQLTVLSPWKGSQGALADSLNRLAAVLQVTAGPAPTYALYHSGFAEYVRCKLPLMGRDRDMYAARVLEQLNDDQGVRRYAARHRWDHLLRSLDLSASIHELPAQGSLPASMDVPLDWRDGIARVRELAPDAMTQAQLLRLLAARALAPSEADTVGSWSAALNCLRAAEQALRSSRALERLDRRGWRFDGAGAPPEMIELEQTLLALGDAYRVIAQRLDVGGQQYDHSAADRSWAFRAWDALVRLPLSLYLLLVLLVQGVREIHIPGALQNLGRGQDWAIARLHVLSVSAFRRARFLVRRRIDETLDDDISERLARTYSLMGAYDAAAATYEQLLSRPAALISPWRQSLWMHALGEVALARGRAARAVETLTNALRIFKQQEAPVLQARALSALAAAHMLQAEENDERPDDVTSLDLDGKALAECSEALEAWRNVTAITGDENAEIDPALEMSRIGHMLWELSRNDRLSDEQARQALGLRATLVERHYPQRFEHPLLRLFRVLATLLLPAILLFGLLLAVQSPSTFLVNTDIELTLQPPLLDLSKFPNNLVNNIDTLPTELTSGDLTQLIASAGWRQYAPAPPNLKAPSYDLRAVASLALGVMLAYLLAYLGVGLLFLLLASPAHQQQRRPGRLIVTSDELIWHGQPALGIWRETLRWANQELRMLTALARARFALALGLEPRAEPAPPVSPDRRVALPAVARAVTLRRSERRRLLGDFSFTQVDSRPAGDDPSATVVTSVAAGRYDTLYLPGSLMFYDELCDDLARRLGGRWRGFTVEILYSISGVFFSLTLLYTTLLVTLTALGVQALQLPLPLAGYSFSDMYVLVAPGLMLPLLWWLVAQPLAARAIRGGALLPLTLATLAGGCLAVAALIGGERSNILEFQPDLFTPILAIGMLVPIVIQAPPRPLRRALIPGWPLLRTLIALAGLVVVLVLTVQASITIAWYHALVQGNLAVRAGLSSDACIDGQECAPLDLAYRRYSALVCLRPGASEGYAFQGFALVASGRYDEARERFFEALETAQGAPPAAPQGCLPTIASQVSPERDAGLHANLGAASLLTAREQMSLEQAEPFYQEALYHSLYALSNSEAAARRAGPASDLVSVIPPGAPLQCPGLARDLAERVGEDTSAAMLPADQAQYLLQIADTCYSRGFSRAREIGTVPLEARQTLAGDAWSDLTAAVEQYDAVAQRASDEREQLLAEHGKAAAWLILGQFDRLPVSAPERRTYLLRALDTYRQLERRDAADEAVFAGQAWCSILLGAWDDAWEPLEAAAALAPDSATYPALQGLVAWLDSTKYETAASDGYTDSISRALAYYTRVIDLSHERRSQAYATRSVLYYSLRNALRSAEYTDSDYGEWMRLAIGDMDRALVLAQDEQLAEPERVGYHYWRGRLAFSLAVTWQRRLRGLHSWDELVPLYSLAYDDFRVAVDNDRNARRQAEYVSLRIPWASYMLNNAIHMQQARQALRAGDYARARDELRLVTPDLSEAQRNQWDPLGTPQPDYSMLHGLIMLGLGQPGDFENRLVPGAQSAEASFKRAIADADDNSLVPQRLRAEYYRQALADLDALTGRQRLAEREQLAVERIRALLQERQAAAGG
jgi:hypothetical protein